MIKNFFAFTIIFVCFLIPQAKAVENKNMEKHSGDSQESILADSELENSLLNDDDMLTDMDGTKSTKNNGAIKVYDPIEPFNRKIFAFNDKVYIYIFDPVSKTYKKIVPSFARTGLKNFFSNLKSPLRIANNLLQGKFKNAGAETGRFFVNTILGFLGFFDSAKKFKPLNPPAEDLGQTFAKWGIGSGPYLVLPLLGASNLRDLTGMAGDIYINPLNQLDSISTEDKYYIKGEETLNAMPDNVDLYKTLKQSAFDPYTSLRNAYMQLRTHEINR